MFCAGLAYRTLVGLSQQNIASFSDERLQSVSHVLEVATRNWGLPLSKNVDSQIRRQINLFCVYLTTTNIDAANFSV